MTGGGPHGASARGVDVVVVRTRSGLRAFQGRCPHQGALLGEGELEGATLVCRNHRWRFSADDGRREGGPECLACLPVAERDGTVFVDVSSLARQRSPMAGRRAVDDLPGPKGRPFVGNLLQLDLDRLHLILERWAAEYGPIYRYRMGRTPVVAVSSPTLAEQILRARPETYRRLGTVEPVFEEMGVAGVFSAEGADWRPQRRLAMEALSPRHLQHFFPTLALVAERLTARWEAAARSGAAVEIVEDLKRFTVDTTTLLAFGHDVNTIGQGDDVIQRQLEQVFPAFNRRLFALFPTWRLLRMPVDRRLDRALGGLRAWLRAMVVETRERLVEDPAACSHPSNFLEAMLVARDDSGRPFTDEVIFGNLMTMLLAGEDTTAYTLGWAVHHLCDSPEAVTALRGELERELGPAAVPREFAIANRLAYAGAIANETMRLRPVAPLLFHQTNVETVLDDVRLPPGTPVVVLTRPPAVSEERFETPRAFRPGRWLSRAAAHDVGAHIPFGSGPRLCPGRTLALLEMKVVLAALYQNFEVERCGSEAVGERFAFTMSPVGLIVRLRARRRRA
jgi:cytochrome P450/nitrite reductase/ring-hydroxylating ferredoxin subunit